VLWKVLQKITRWSPHVLGALVTGPLAHHLGGRHCPSTGCSDACHGEDRPTMGQTAHMTTNTAGSVEAGPTKQFFVSMITRDIALQPAIVDLVDNSIDGARRVRGDGDLRGLHVKLRYSASEFLIEDNCGGIDLDTARRFAFKFGRTDDAPGVAHSVGQFGVGMKRALFKLGSAFRVESLAENSSFILEVDVPAWQALEQWAFPLESADETTTRPLEETGTRLQVQPLHEGVAADLALDMFTTTLVAELRAKHRVSISRGLFISVNGSTVSPWPITLLSAAEITPGQRSTRYAALQPAPVDVVVTAGINESAPSEAGWYVFCNSRLVLGPDVTNLTGWGEGRGRTIPRFHTQFSRFRGYVFFDSDRADLLPLTTTKVGVDTTSPLWRATRQQTIVMTRPVINFLNAMDWENPQVAEGEVGTLEKIVDEAKAVPVPVRELTEISFLAPGRDVVQPPPATSSIQYRRLVEDIDRAKELLGVSTNWEVGDRTFDYFFEAES